MAEFEKGRIIERDAAVGAKLLSMGMGKKGEEGVGLEWLEAAFLVERKLLQVKEGQKVLTLDDLLAGPEKEKKKEKIEKEKAPKTRTKSKNADSLSAPSRAEQYRIYRAIRGGGRVVRFTSGSPLYWRVYERGVGREQERPQMLYYIVTPEWSVSLSSLEQQMQLARLLRLDLGLAFVRDGRTQMMRISRPPVEG
ncbi:Uncharacterised protein [uncultured archaeon]|nr:Uncharacterised protein [uncultured archaeon]